MHTQVRRMLEQLPGGPSQAAQLAQLLARRAALLARQAALASKCVPRPQPPQYHALHQEVAGFAGGMGQPARLLALAARLERVAAAGPFSSNERQAEQEAAMWVGNAAAWASRLGSHYDCYQDLVQPVQLAVAEMRQGLALLLAAARAAPQAAGSTQAEAWHQMDQSVALAGGLMAFPLTLASQPAATGDAAAPLAQQQGAPVLPVSALADGRLAAAAAALVAGAQQQQLAAAGVSAESARRAADLAAYTWQLQATRAALHVCTQELLLLGPAALSTADSSAAAAEQPADVAAAPAGLGRLHALLGRLLEAWQQVKEFEAAEAAEEAAVYKTKTQSITIINEEVCFGFCCGKGGGHMLCFRPLFVGGWGRVAQA